MKRTKSDNGKIHPVERAVRTGANVILFLFSTAVLLYMFSIEQYYEIDGAGEPVAHTTSRWFNFIDDVEIGVAPVYIACLLFTVIAFSVALINAEGGEKRDFETTSFYGGKVFEGIFGVVAIITIITAVVCSCISFYNRNDMRSQAIMKDYDIGVHASSPVLQSEPGKSGVRKEHLLPIINSNGEEKTDSETYLNGVFGSDDDDLGNLSDYQYKVIENRGDYYLAMVSKDAKSRAEVETYGPITKSKVEALDFFLEPVE